MTTMARPNLTCRQQGCPFPEVQKCLEAFEDVAECPNTVSVDQDIDPLDGLSDDAPQAVPNRDAEDGDTSTTTAESMVELGGAVALSIDEASDFVARESARVVLIAGPVGSGKTTLVVELYARFLYGPFETARFGGSETLRALDSRHFPAQEHSGGASASTDRTQDEDVRLLHLKIALGSVHHQLLFTDVRGELFENIVDGAPAANEIPIGPRVDRCFLVIDGERAANPRQRDVVFSDAKQLAGGLRAAGGLAADTPVAVLCTKWDLVPEESRGSILKRATTLSLFAASEKQQAKVLAVSVRPGPPNTAIAGLNDVMSWLTDAEGSAR